MPKVFSEGPYVFRFFSNEGDEPPHVHVIYDRDMAKFWLNPDPVELARNYGIAQHRLTRVQSLVQQHRTRLLEAWHDHFGGR